MTLYDACNDEMDMVGIGRILDVAPHRAYSAFDLFRVSVLDTNGATLYGVCTNKMDMIGIGRILNAAPHKPRSGLDLFEVSMLELEDDGSVTDVVAFDFTFVERTSNYVDPHLSFDYMSRFVTRYDDMFVEYNNDIIVFEY